MIAAFWGPMLDCPDPRLLAEFYQRICGGRISTDNGSFTELRLDGLSLGFQRDPGHRPPTWPDPLVPQQCHLDFMAADLDAAEMRVLQIGAVKAELQPAPDSFRVYFDPAGHPFCLSKWGTPAESR